MLISLSTNVVVEQFLSTNICNIFNTNFIYFICTINRCCIGFAIFIGFLLPIGAIGMMS